MPDISIQDLLGQKGVVSLLLRLAIALVVIAVIITIIIYTLYNQNQDLKKQLQQLTPQAEQLKIDNQNLVADVKDLNSKLTDLEKKNIDLTTTNQSLIDENTKLKKDNASWVKEVQQLTNDKAVLVTEKKNLTDQNVILTNNEKDLQIKVDDFQTKLSNDINLRVSEEKLFITTAGDLNNKITDLKTKNDALLVSNTTLLASYNKIGIQNNELISKNTLLENDVRNANQAGQNIYASSIPLLGMVTFLCSGLGVFGGLGVVVIRLKKLIGMSQRGFVFAVFDSSKKFMINNNGKITCANPNECKSENNLIGLQSLRLTNEEIKYIIRLRRRVI
jgi:hypothetical protein